MLHLVKLQFVDHTLVEDGYTTANYHGAVPANERATNFESFVGGEAHVLVTTDLAARGLDEVRLLYDCRGLPSSRALAVPRPAPCRLLTPADAC